MAQNEPNVAILRYCQWSKILFGFRFFLFVLFLLQQRNILFQSTLEYKKKHRPLKISLTDGTVKTVLIDDSLTVAEIVDVVGKKMGILFVCFVLFCYSLNFGEFNSQS
jgi:hypothetical protein